MQELPLVLEQALLLSVPRREVSIVLSLVLVWLEWRLPHNDFIVLSHSLLLARQVLGLLHGESLLHAKWGEAHLTLDGAFALFEELVGLAKHLRMVAVLLTVVLLLESAHHVALFLVHGQLVLPV